MKRIRCERSCIFLVAVLVLLGCRKPTSNQLGAGYDERERVVMNVGSEREALIHLLGNLRFERFDADGVDLNEVLRRIEEFVNSSRDFNGGRLVFSNSAGGEFNPSLTIVLRDVSVGVVLKLIEEQTGMVCEVDPEELTVIFYGSTDIIDVDANWAEDPSPTILPPPEEGVPE